MEEKVKKGFDALMELVDNRFSEIRDTELTNLVFQINLTQATLKAQMKNVRDSILDDEMDEVVCVK